MTACQPSLREQSPLWACNQQQHTPLAQHSRLGPGQVLVVAPAHRHFAGKAKQGKRGGRTKVYTAYKGRFKENVDPSTGKTVITYWRPGHRHKAFVKTSKRKRALRMNKTMHDTYAKTMQRLGFRRASL